MEQDEPEAYPGKQRSLLGSSQGGSQDGAAGGVPRYSEPSSGARPGPGNSSFALPSSRIL